MEKITYGEALQSIFFVRCYLVVHMRCGELGRTVYTGVGDEKCIINFGRRTYMEENAR
jgi:hypothetical protein